MDIRREALNSSVATALIAALNAELSRLYPEEGATHFRLDVDEVQSGRGAFLVAYDDERPVGCGAIRRLDERRAEIKRMFVEPGSRGRGAGRCMLNALETEARKLGVSRIVLETGDRDPAAIRLYESAGFVRIPRFGEYEHSPLSICMEKLI